jgi:hypothetical protein
MVMILLKKAAKSQNRWDIWHKTAFMGEGERIKMFGVPGGGGEACL